MITYKYSDKLYSVVPCTIDDIPSHIEKVLSYWGTDELDVQKQRMERAVNNNTAYKLVDSDNNYHTFAYYEDMGSSEACGIALWWSYFRLFFIFGLWFKKYSGINYVYILPHGKDVVFESLVTKDSIKKYLRDNREPLCIDMTTSVYSRVKLLTKTLNIAEV